MLQEAIYKFKTIGPILLPDLIDNFWIGEIKAYEDYAILPYEVHAPQHIEKVIDMFEMNADLAILYHLEPSIDTVFGHECCAYCYPVTERMFKINCKTHVDGLIHELNVTIYNSIEVMSSDLFEDLRLHEKRGTFRIKRKHVQIMNDFNCGLWMETRTYYLIADIIENNRTWIRLTDTEKLIEMRIPQDGVLKTLFYKSLTLQSYRDHYLFRRKRTWNINEYDLNRGLAALCKKDPSAKRRIAHDSLTLRDVEYIIEKASFGIIKLELDDYDY